MNLDYTKLKDVLFKIKKLSYNTYDVEHPKIGGQLRLVDIPQNFVKMPSNSNVEKAPQFGVVTQTVVGFTNRNQKLKPANLPVTPDQLSDKDKENITSYIENENEPWNEFLLEGNFTVRLKTVLTNVTWLKTVVNTQGDPVIWTSTNINMDVSESKIGEAGLK